MRSWLIHIFCIIALVAMYAWLPVQGFDLWNSPDETAVAFASDPVATGLGLNTPLVQTGSLAGGLVHPRSMAVVDGHLVPTGFLGWPWLLRLWRETPLNFAWTWVPALVAALGVLAFGDIIRRLSGRDLFGWFAAFFLATHPAWWYFANRGLLPNVAFVSMGIFAVWAAIVSKQSKKKYTTVLALLAGIFLGLAGFIRLNEFVWLLPCVVVFGVWCWRKDWSRWLVAGVGFLAMMSMSGLVSFAVYGSAFTTGYTLVGDVAPAISLPDYAEAITSPRVWWQWLFPFGIHEMNTLRNAWHYLWLPFWTTTLAVCGLVYVMIFRCLHKDGAHPVSNAVSRGSRSFQQGVCRLCHRIFGNLMDLLLPRRLFTNTARHCPAEPSREARSGSAGDPAPPDEQVTTISMMLFLIIGTSITYLLILYGSWNVTDNPTPGEITIGVSYMRYWLPIFVMGCVAAAWVVLAVSDVIKNRWGSLARNATIGAIVVATFGIGFWQTYSGMEGLWAVRDTLAQNQKKQEWVLQNTTSADLILTVRDDKVLFPHRSVVAGFLEKGIQARLGSLADAIQNEGGHLFYFGPTFSATDEQYLREQVLEPQGLGWRVVREGDESVLVEVDRVNR